tara:strand:- start:216 stop:443 length:228 start_codon:yes stop_codon:yes gene_type:complete
MKSTGTYSIVEDNYELEVYYEYYWNDGDNNYPPEADIEILEVKLNGMDITDFYWDWINDSLSTDIWEYAQENKNN